MDEKPISFSGHRVRAILDGRMTQMRKILNPQPAISGTSNLDHFQSWVRSKTNHVGVFIPGTEQEYWMPTSKSGKVGIFKPPQYKCPYGSVGDRLWVRETWGVHVAWDDVKPIKIEAPLGLNSIWYAADSPKLAITGKTRLSIHMPRWASRITLEITNVRVERVQDITNEDALSEGVKKRSAGGYEAWGKTQYVSGTPIGAFVALWDSINGKKYPWESKPWVWVIEFKRI